MERVCVAAELTRAAVREHDEPEEIVREVRRHRGRQRRGNNITMNQTSVYFFPLATGRERGASIHHDVHVDNDVLFFFFTSEQKV
jgi:hypothetical protein